MARYKRTNNNFKQIMTYLFAFFVASLVIIIVYFYVDLNANKPEIDKETLCEKNTSYSKQVVLVDITDMYNFVQINDIKLKVENIIRNLNKGEQIKVYFLNDNVSEDNIPAINVCNPGKASDANYLYSNPKLIEKKWREKFYLPLSKTISKIDSNSTYNYSPIIEMIQWINIKEFKNNNSENNNLVIISDMIQNSKEFSFFKSKLTKFTSTEYFNKYRTNLNNVDVQIMLTRRDKLSKFQSKDFLNFWYEYFSSQNAILSKIVRIDG